MADSVLFPAMNRMITAIEGYMKKGVIADMPAMTTAKLLMTTILGYFYAAFVAGVIFPNDNPERDAEYLITYIVGGLGACNGNRRAEEAGK
ncbi:hypothetical protein SDC9_173038 [bioreactor metagenome]|uniref:Uncharacterized protein n=1 Tax=bioreactor metagenome TaxID=1076179 RepID=A0A645GHG5_9ZZZZ